MSDKLAINYVESGEGVVIIYGSKNGECATPWVTSINIEKALNMLIELYPEYTEYAIKFLEMRAKSEQ